MLRTGRSCSDYAAQIAREYGIPLSVQKDPAGVYVKIEGAESGFLSSPIMCDAYLMGIADLAEFMKSAKKQGDLP